MEIIPNQVILVECSDGMEVKYGGWVDTAHLFHDSRYNHIKYWDAEAEVFNYHFLGREALASLIDLGIPPVKRGDQIFQSEVDCHKDYCYAIIDDMIADETEDMNILGYDPIEDEVRKATRNLDKELRYYLEG